MHDPKTVAFEIRYPWKAYSKEERAARPGSEFTQNYRAPFITIWHVDPEKDGTDDSCDWFNRKRKPAPLEAAVGEAMWDLETILDNKPHYPDSREHKAFQPLSAAVRNLLHQPSRTHWWQLHPRWHFWHWEIQVRPYQNARRWLLTRCCKCGGRFKYGESPVSGSWDHKPPRWFRGEEGMYHMDCNRPGKDCAAQASR